MTKPFHKFCLIFLLWLLFFPLGRESDLARPAWAKGTAEPNPPELILEVIKKVRPPHRVPLEIPVLTEWTFHKTADNLHPDANEQQMMWLMNRARANPAAEGVWLVTMDDPDVVSAISFFNVDTELVKSEFAAIPAKPPAGFDVRLYNAALEHSEYMIANNVQGHDGQVERIDNAGFSYTTWRGSVFAYAESAVHCHAALNIDWGESADGMQEGRGHRVAIMSIDRDLTNVGIAIKESGGLYPDVGPLVMTGNYCTANTSEPDHYNRFLVGTVWEDENQNALYDPGEGMGGVTVTPDRGSYYAVTSESGGYAFPLTETGMYEITFSGNAIPAGSVRTREVGQESVLLDVIIGQGAGGDINADGVIDLNDALLSMKILSKLETSLPQIPGEADMNGDGKIGLEEAVFILRKTAEE